MIKNLYGNSSWLTISQQGTTMPYLNTTQPMTGMIRVNPGMSRTEVYDGQNWVQFGSDAHVDLSEHSKKVLLWAEGKMEEDAKLKQLIDKHPGLRDAYERLEIMKALVMEQESNAS